MAFLQNPCNVLIRICGRKKEKRKNRMLSVARLPCRDDQIATGTKMLDIKYQFYGFSGDLIEIIN